MIDDSGGGCAVMHDVDQKKLVLLVATGVLEKERQSPETISPWQGCECQ